jgi:hypothetical protein
MQSWNFRAAPKPKPQKKKKPLACFSSASVVHDMTGPIVMSFKERLLACEWPQNKKRVVGPKRRAKKAGQQIANSISIARIIIIC